MTELKLAGFYLYPPRQPKRKIHWFWLVFILIILLLLIGRARAEDYPICKDFDSSKETFGEHKWKEHSSGQDYVHEFNEPDWDKIIPIIIQIESSGNPNAVSKNGCVGLMQVSPMVLKEFNSYWRNQLTKYPGEPQAMGWVNARIGIAELFDIRINIEIGTWYLKRIWYHYLPHYKLEQTIQNLCYAYNMGIGNLVKYRQGKKKLPDETRQYVKKFWRLYNEK